MSRNQLTAGTEVPSNRPAAPHAEAHGERSTPSMHWAHVALSLSMLLSSLGTSIANVALPTLATEFDASFPAVQWVVLAYLLAITSSIVGIGRLGDLIGRRRLLAAGLLLFTAAAVVSGIAPALWMVIGARAAQGLGAAVMMALTLAFVSEVTPRAKTGSAMGLLGTMSAIGTGLGPSLGGALIGWVGWRAVFLVQIPLGLVALLLACRYLPADRPTEKAKHGGFDALGTLLLALTLTAYALAVTIGRGHFGATNVALLVASLIGAALFLFAETRAPSPLLHLALFRDRALRTGLAANVLVSAVVMSTLVVGPFYLSLTLGLDPGLVGLVMSAGPIVAALTGFPAGRVVDRFGVSRMTLVGLGAIALGAAMLSLAPDGLGVLGYVAPVVVVTAGYALFQAANNTALMRDVGAGQRGVVSGTLSLSRNLGLITGASVMGAVFALAVGTNDIAGASAAAVATGMRITFGAGAALIVVAIALVAGTRAFAPRGLASLVTKGKTSVLAWTLLFLASPIAAGAQERSGSERPEAPLLAGDDGGFVLRSADGTNSIGLVGLFQPQLTYDGNDDRSALFLNRARAGFLGTLVSKDLSYMMVAELAGANPKLMFLSVDYQVVRDWLAVTVGQVKRPFSRPFITPASQLSMIDRPLTVGPKVFGDNADIGLTLHNGTSEPGFQYAVGVFNGTGPNVVPDRAHPLLAARVGYATGGLRGFQESDLEGGALRMGIGAAGLFDFDADRDDRSFTSGLVDLMVKAYGGSLTSALYVGSRQDGPHWSDQRFNATGHYTQLGYVVARRFEPVVRYSFLLPDGEGNDLHDVAAGLNVFFRGHALKWQTVASVRHQSDPTADTRDVRLQSQLTLAL